MSYPKIVLMISTARLSATANPFIIYDFYDLVEKVIQEKKLEPRHLWNCDESGFPTNPARCKVVSLCEVHGRNC